MKAKTAVIGLIIGLSVLSPYSQAGTLIVGTGATLDSGSGSLHLACSQLRISGNLRGEVDGTGAVQIEPGGSVQTRLLAFSGHWSNKGAAEVHGEVQWQDGCSVVDASMLGNSDFDRLVIHSASGGSRRLDTGGLQYVANHLTLAGTSDQRLMLRSTQAGQRAALLLSPSASQTINRVDVADIDASGGQTLAPGEPEQFGSIDSGNSLNWFVVEIIDSIFRTRFEAN